MNGSYRFPPFFTLASLLLVLGCDTAVWETPGVAADDLYSVRSTSISIDTPYSPYHTNARSISLSGACSGAVDRGQKLLVTLNLADLSEIVACTNGSYEASLNVEDLSEGQYTLSASVLASGRTDRVAATIETIIDRTPPRLATDAVIPPGPRDYSTGNQIDFSIKFNERVTFDGHRRPEFEIRLIDASGDDSVRRPAYFLSANEEQIGFRYLVQEGDNGQQGIKLSGLNLFESRLTDMAGNEIISNIDWGISDYLPITANQVVIDTTLLTIEAIGTQYLQKKYFTIDEEITFRVKVNRPVFFRNPSTYIVPRLLLRIGDVVKYANYSGIDEIAKNIIRFSYNVVKGDIDDDGVEVTAFESNGAYITDASGTRLLTSLPTTGGATTILLDKILIDATPPVIESITIDKTSYKAGDQITFYVDYDREVVVDGSPELRFGYDAADKVATYRDVSADTLIFTYAIAKGEEADQIIIPSRPISLGNANIATSNGNTASNDFNETSYAVTLDAAIPKINDVGTNKPGEVIKEGEKLIFILTLSEEVTIGLSSDATADKPQLSVEIISSGEPRIRHLVMQESNGESTNKLSFAYVVEEEIENDDGVISLLYSKMNGAQFTDKTGNLLAGQLGEWLKAYEQRVDARPPKIIRLNPPESKTYSLEESSNSLDFDLVFDQKVIYLDDGNNNKDIHLKIDISGDDYSVVYKGPVSPDEDGYTTTQRFAFAIQEGLRDTNGISINEGWFLAYQGADQFRDKNGITNNMDATTDDINLTGVLINSIRPVISRVEYSKSKSPNNAAFGINENNVRTIDIIFTIADPKITVVGNPGFPMRLGTDDDYKIIHATYDRHASAGQSSQLVFAYTLSPSDNDNDGLHPGRSDNSVDIELNGGSITGTANNPLVATNLGLIDGMNTLKDILIDNIKPQISRVQVPLGITNLYNGDSLELEVVLSEDVWLNNLNVSDRIILPVLLGDNPSIPLLLKLDETATSPRKLLNFSGVLPEDLSTSKILLDPSHDALIIPIITTSDGLQLQDKLLDKAGNDISADFPADRNLRGLTIHTALPQVKQIDIQEITGKVDSAGNKYFRQGDSLEITIGWSERVEISGNPRLPLRLSSSADPKYADYSGDGGPSNVTRFEYLVKASDNAPEGIFLGASSSSIELDLKDVGVNKIVSADGGKNAKLSLEHLKDLTGDGDQAGKIASVIIDNIAPTVSKVELPQERNYKIGDTFAFDFVMSEKVRYIPAEGQNPQGKIRVYISDDTYVNAAYIRDQTSDDKNLSYKYTLTEEADTPKLHKLLFVYADLSADGESISDWAGNQMAADFENGFDTSDDIFLFNTKGPIAEKVSWVKQTSYGFGETLGVTVSFNEELEVTPDGELYLRVHEVRIGEDSTPTIHRFVRDPSHDTPNNLTFTWKVPEGVTYVEGFDFGDATAATSVIYRVSDNTRILDKGGVESDYRLPSTHFDSIIDGKAPSISSIDLTSDGGTYKISGDTLTLRLEFDETVDYIADLNSPSMPWLRINADRTVDLAYTSKESGNTLVFEYTIANGMESDTDRQLSLLAGTLFTGSGKIKDKVGNPFTSEENFNNVAIELDYAGIVIDSKNPSLTSQAYTSDKSGTVAKTGDKLFLTLNLSEDVTVDSSASIAFTLGTSSKTFTLVGPTAATSSLKFEYTVRNGDVGEISIDAKLNVRDKANNLGVIVIKTPTNSASIPIKANEPVIQSVNFLHDLTDDVITDRLRIQLVFNQPVQMSPTDGVLELIFSIPEGLGNSQGRAVATFADATTEVIFSHDLNNVYTLNGIEFSSSKIRPNGDARLFLAADPSVDALLDFAHLLGEGSQLAQNLKRVRLSNIIPEIGTTRSNFLDEDVPREFVTENLELTLVFATPVRIANPQGANLSAALSIPFVLGGNQRHFSYAPTADSTDDKTFKFSYNPQYGDVDLDGIEFGTVDDTTDAATTITVSDGVVLRGRYDDNTADGRLSNSSDFAALKGKLPTINYPRARVTGVALVADDPSTDRVLARGDSQVLRIYFSHDITYDTAPSLALQIGDTSIDISADSNQSSSKFIDFTYTASTGQLDNDGIATLTSGALIGTLKEVRGDNTIDAAQRSAANGAQFSQIMVDAVPPYVTGVVVPDGNYKKGATIDIRVNLSEAVEVTGDISYKLLLQSTEKNNPATRILEDPVLVNNNQLQFTYGVRDDDNDNNGIVLQGLHGDIRDVYGNAAELTGADLSFDGVLIDTKIPVIESIELVNANYDTLINPVYGNNDLIYILLKVSEQVRVSPATLFSIRVGDNTRDFGLDATTDSTIRFKYTVEDGDDAAASLTAVSISDNIADAAGNRLDTASLTFMRNVTVSTQDIKLNVFALPPDAATIYGLGATLELIADFNLDITDVSNAPAVKLGLKVGAKDVTADLDRTADGNLVFSLKVTSGLNGAVTMRDFVNPGNISAIAGQVYAGESLSKFNDQAPVANLLVDTSPPRITGVEATSDYYTKDKEIIVRMHFDEKIRLKVEDGGRLAYELKINGVTPFNIYAQDVSGTTSTLNFIHQVESGQTDRDGIELSKLRQFSYITDLADNQLASDATTDYHLKEVKIDSKAPAIKSLTTVDKAGDPSTQAVYQNRDMLRIKLTFTENVAFHNPGGEMLLNAEAPDSTVDLEHQHSLQTADALVFAYDVSVDKEYSNLRFSALSGDIKDAAGNVYVLANAPRAVTGITLTSVTFSVTGAAPNTLTAGVAAPSYLTISGTGLNEITTVLYNQGVADTTCDIGSATIKDTIITGIDCSAVSNPGVNGSAQIKVQNLSGNAYTYTGFTLVAAPTLTSVDPVPTRTASVFPSAWTIRGNNLKSIDRVKVNGTTCDSTGDAGGTIQRNNVRCANIGPVPDSDKIILGVTMPDGYEATTDISTNPVPAITSLYPDHIVSGSTAPGAWKITGANLANIATARIFIDATIDSTTTCSSFTKDSTDLTVDCSNSPTLAYGNKARLDLLNPDNYTVSSDVRVIGQNLPVKAGTEATVDATYGESFNFDSIFDCTDATTSPSYAEQGTADLLELGSNGDATPDNGPGKTQVSVSCPASDNYARAAQNYTVDVARATPTLTFTLNTAIAGKQYRYLQYDATDNNFVAAVLSGLKLYDTLAEVLDKNSGGSDTGTAKIEYSLGDNLSNDLTINASTGQITILNPSMSLIDQTVDVNARFVPGSTGIGSFYASVSADYVLQLVNIGLPKEHRVAAAIYSLRLANPDYTGDAIRVGCNDNDATRDIGFTATGNLDSVALLNFVNGCTGANGSIHAWYDQSGNKRDFAQTVTGQQPQIVRNGTIETRSNWPAISFDGTDDTLQITNTGLLNGAGEFSVFMLTDSGAGSPATLLDMGSTNGGMLLQKTNDNLDLRVSFTNGKTGTSTQSDFTGDQKQLSLIVNDTKILSRVDGTSDVSSDLDAGTLDQTHDLYLGSLHGSGSHFQGKMQELVIYGSDKSTALGTIEENQSDYWQD